MINQPKKYEDDDNRTICDMNVDGMPWHDKFASGAESASEKGRQGERMTRSEARLYTWYAVLAGLLIATVFSVAAVLFTLFCTKVWFR